MGPVFHTHSTHSSDQLCQGEIEWVEWVGELWGRPPSVGCRRWGSFGQGRQARQMKATLLYLEDERSGGQKVMQKGCWLGPSTSHLGGKRAENGGKQQTQESCAGRHFSSSSSSSLSSCCLCTPMPSQPKEAQEGGGDQGHNSGVLLLSHTTNNTRSLAQKTRNIPHPHPFPPPQTGTQAAKQTQGTKPNPTTPPSHSISPIPLSPTKVMSSMRFPPASTRLEEFDVGQVRLSPFPPPLPLHPLTHPPLTLTPTPTKGHWPRGVRARVPFPAPGHRPRGRFEGAGQGAPAHPPPHPSGGE